MANVQYKTREIQILYFVQGTNRTKPRASRVIWCVCGPCVLAQGIKGLQRTGTGGGGAQKHNTSMEAIQSSNTVGEDSN